MPVVVVALLATILLESFLRRRFQVISFEVALHHLHHILICMDPQLIQAITQAVIQQLRQTNDVTPFLISKVTEQVTRQPIAQVPMNARRFPSHNQIYHVRRPESVLRHFHVRRPD